MTSAATKRRGRSLADAIARRGRARALDASEWVKLAAADGVDAMRGNRCELVPPRRYRLPGWRADFRRSGDFWFRTLRELGGLTPESRVLDVGCGPGRIAIPLAQHLEEGSYDGFDVLPAAVEWGRSRISSRYPSFRFQLADIGNGLYNPEGSEAASSYRFPYPDDGFDVGVATSLFTHLRPADTEHYLREAARVLKPGGRLLSTFFLLTEGRPIAGREGSLRLEAELTDEAGRRYRARNARTPEHRVALAEKDVRAMHDAAGLSIRDIRYGRWFQQPRGRQDLVIAVKG